MNFKTTFLLLIVLVGLLALTLVREVAPKSAAPTPLNPQNPEASTTSRDIFDPKPGDATKLVIQRKDQPAWIFEKDEKPDASGRPAWRMVAPLQTSVAGFEIDRVTRQISGLQYDVSHKPGQPGSATPQESGVEKPETVVTMTDASGASHSVEIGRPASESETYVRVAGKEPIFVAKASLKTLVKAKAMEYRDLQFWNFPAEKVARVEILDQTKLNTPVQYAFVRDGTKWNMVAPVAAKATSKVDDVLRSINRLRGNKWEDDRKEKWPVYGLEPAAWIIRTTVEEEVPIEKATAKVTQEGETPQGEEETPKTEKKVTTYVLHVSDQSPVGDETKVYVRAGDEPLSATIAKTMADKFKVVPNEWRDMHVTSANISEATRIEISVPDGKTALVKNLGRWALEGGGPAEDASVKALLKGITDLTAVSFTDVEPIDPAVAGFNQPQAEIRLTVPGAEAGERIAVGGYTDSNSKRLAYVRRNELTSFAKVRAADLTPLTQHPRSYRDRTIVDTPTDRFEKITVTATSPYTNEKQGTTLERMDGQWSMTQPKAAAVRVDRVDPFVTGLGSLRAESIVAEDSSVTAFGLDSPNVVLTWTFKPPIEYRIDPKSGEGSQGQDGGAEKVSPVEVQPPSQTAELRVTEHDGKFYAKRADRPAIFQISAEFYKQLFSEWRTPGILSFDDTQVTRFSIHHGDQKHAFEKRAEKWIYGPEPDLPLDQAKIKNLLLQLKDLKTERYIRYGSAEFSSYGLSNPIQQVTVELTEGTSLVLVVSPNQTEKGPDKGHYAQVKGRDEVFLLPMESLSRFQVSLADLEAKK
ncbi:MAG: DUF4340 domain-containing protein [Planctomycetota bacterium]